MDALSVVAQVLILFGLGYAVGRWHRASKGPLPPDDRIKASLAQAWRDREVLYDAAFLRAVRARYSCDEQAARRVLHEYHEYLCDAQWVGGVQLTPEGELRLPPVGDRLFDSWLVQAGLNPRAPPGDHAA
jgi:hypothetical protein